ncbi:transposase [Gluconacetobacter takamatsuzukensis]
MDGAGGKSRACPRCRSDRIGAWGYAHGLPRYRCKTCLRTFNALTGTSLARLRHKDRWLGFAAALAQATSIRKTAKACAITIRTSFRWQHRFLAAPSCEQPALMSGIVEADETFFRRSFKGVHAWSHSGEGIIPPLPASSTCSHWVGTRSIDGELPFSRTQACLFPAVPTRSGPFPSNGNTIFWQFSNIFWAPFPVFPLFSPLNTKVESEWR